MARVFTFLALSEHHHKQEIAIFDVLASNGPSSQLDPPVTRLPQRSIEELSPSLFSQYDIVINTLPVSLSEQMLAIAAESTCGTFVDVSSDGLEIPEQVEYSEDFEQEGRLLLSSVGIAPGLDNLLVADLVDRGATWVKIHLIEHSTDETCVPSWCEEDAAISSNDKPISFNDGMILRHGPFDSPQTLSTSAGTFTFYRYFGEEVLSLARNYPTLSIDHYAGGHEVEVAWDFVINGKRTVTSSTNKDLEPEGVFGIKIVSDVATVEVILKNTTQLRTKALPGNHISYHTGAMLYYSLKHALEYEERLVGTVFPENLPSSVREAILEEVREKLATNYTFFSTSKMSTPNAVDSSDKKCFVSSPLAAPTEVCAAVSV